MNIQSEFAKVLGGKIYNHKLQIIVELSGCYEDHLTYSNLMFEERGKYEDFNIVVENDDIIVKKHLPYELCCMIVPALKMCKPTINNRIDKELFLKLLKSIVYKIAGTNDTEAEESSKIRLRELVVPRQIIMSVYAKSPIITQKISLRESGDIYSKNHATVLHACRAIHNLIHTDKRFYYEWKEVFDFAFPETPVDKIILYNGK